MRFTCTHLLTSLLSLSLLTGLDDREKTSTNSFNISIDCPEIISTIKGGSYPLETTFLFVDKSVSINPSKDYALSKYQNQTKLLLKEHVHQDGDRLVVYQVHHSTLTGEVFDYTFRTSVSLDNVCNKADKVVRSLKNQYEDEIFTQTNNRRKSIHSILNSHIGVAGNQTDLWGTLQVICEEKPKTPIVNVYYYSDMVESMKGTGRRDLHKRYPKSISEANKFATEDLNKIKHVCTINQTLLKKLRLTIVLPHPPDAAPEVSKPYVKTYWQQLLAGLGVKHVEFA